MPVRTVSKVASTARLNSAARAMSSADAAKRGGVCLICQEALHGGDRTPIIPCQYRHHNFHTNCIAKWLAHSKRCPICLTDVY